MKFDAYPFTHPSKQAPLQIPLLSLFLNFFVLLKNLALSLTPKTGVFLVFYVLMSLLLPLFPLYSFVPETPKRFIETSLNLLNNRQYTFLSEYVESYYPALAQRHAKLPIQYKKELETLIKTIPLLSAREKILRTLLKEWDPIYPQQPSSFHCLYGELHIAQKQYDEALRAYERCKSTLRNFYLALIEKTRNNLPQSERLFLKALRTTKKQTVRDEIYLSLAYLTFKQKRYSEALDYASRSRVSTRRAVSLYNIYHALNDKQKAEKTLSLLKKQFKNPKEFQDFLKQQGKGIANQGTQLEAEN